MMCLKHKMRICLPFIVFSLSQNLFSQNLHQGWFNPGLGLSAQAKDLGPLAPHKKIQAQAWLKWKNIEKLDRMLDDIYNPKSEQYQKYLSPAEIKKNHELDDEEKAAALKYFIHQGMDAKLVNHRIEFTATVQQIEHTFGVHLHRYLDQGRTVYTHLDRGHVDHALAPYISEITGLSTTSRFYPMIRKKSFLPKDLSKDASFAAQPLDFIWKNFEPKALPSTTSMAGFTGAQLQKTYAIDAISSVKTQSINGTGQTLVVLDVCPSSQISVNQIMADANHYFNDNHITPFTTSNFKVIDSSGSAYNPSSCTHGDIGWYPEISLDLEASHTLAPADNTILVLASSAYDQDLAGAIDNLYTTLSGNSFNLAGFSNTYIISNSYGGLEYANNPMDAMLKASAAVGLSFVFSTGDNGDNNASGGRPTVEYPASSAYVTSVGGTSIFVDNNWNYAFESVWGSGANVPTGGSGGGISLFYPKPSWQNLINSMTASGYVRGNIGIYNRRALPDIAALGDPETGLAVYTSYQGRSGYSVFGGTSLAAPLISASTLLINQSRFLLGKTPIGLMASYLYSAHDALMQASALNFISPPHKIISGAKSVSGHLSAFSISGVTFNWDSSLGVLENQFWSDATGLGSPYLPSFIRVMATQ